MDTTYRFVFEVDRKTSSFETKSYNGDDWVEIFDTSRREHGRVRAKEVSIYRHALLLDGKMYSLLNVLKDSPSWGKAAIEWT
jgi:hypothetical protein